jgi:cytochrome c5
VDRKMKFGVSIAAAALILDLAHAASTAHWDKVTVELPVTAQLFPAGDGASIANSQCLICHSAEMVLTQPPRTQQQWTDTINKMRTTYGARLPADQVDELAIYLSRLDLGR